MNELPDDELVRRYNAGEMAAFDAIVDRYERHVYAVALRMCGNPEDARDAVQDAFIGALRGLKGFRSESKLSTWLHRLAVNASLDVIRKRSRRQAQPLDELHERASEEQRPDDAAVESERAAAVRRALQALSPDHRAVVVLHDLQGLDYVEVAEALGIALGTVKSRLHRARIELARRLGHLREPEPSGGSAPLR